MRVEISEKERKMLRAAAKASYLVDRDDGYVKLANRIDRKRYKPNTKRVLLIWRELIKKLGR